MNGIIEYSEMDLIQKIIFSFPFIKREIEKNSQFIPDLYWEDACKQNGFKDKDSFMKRANKEEFHRVFKCALKLWANSM